MSFQPFFEGGSSPPRTTQGWVAQHPIPAPPRENNEDQYYYAIEFSLTWELFLRLPFFRQISSVICFLAWPFIRLLQLLENVFVSICPIVLSTNTDTGPDVRFESQHYRSDSFIRRAHWRAQIRSWSLSSFTVSLGFFRKAQ